MIKKEFFKQRKDGVKLYKTYSDIGMLIQQEQTRVIYSEAIDVENTPYTYIETDTPIEKEVKQNAYYN